ncbi:virion structural protein [Pseudomonas phage 201phi2-1]|uniref:Virion structural protein n=1 Tax=Pseudomonas phage 201phi2-1 TaxID=198110 RepID=B3FJ74_BP201|nr:virion structural protein [Pseudomonas phage 201phi2-1]ABY63041.1 virion structural protein [Pseudomonas phage 201phi2-1]
MYSTKDYLAADPWVAVINRINEVYLTDLTPYTATLKSMVSLGGTRTQIEVDARRSIDPNNTQPEVTRENYVYDRLDLASFFVGPAIKQLSDFALPTNTFKVLAAIGELNDIVFTLNDFVHVQYDEYQRVYTLTASPKSLRFVGSVQFELVNTTKQLLANVGDKLELITANPRPLGSVDGKIVSQFTTSGFDFTHEREFIKDLSSASVWPSGRKLAAILNDVTTYPFVCSTEVVDWNIAGEVISGEARLSVLYNGIVLPRYSPRKDIQQVCVLRVSGLANNMSGYLLLHYN